MTRCVCHGPQRDSERLAARPAPPPGLPGAPRRVDDLAEWRLALQRRPRGLRLRPNRVARVGRGSDGAAARPLRRAGTHRWPRRRPVRPPVGDDLVGRGASSVDGWARGRRRVRRPGARGHPARVHNHGVRNRVPARDDGDDSRARRRGRPRGGQRAEHAGRQPDGRRRPRGRRGDPRLHLSHRRVRLERVQLRSARDPARGRIATPRPSADRRGDIQRCVRGVRRPPPRRLASGHALGGRPRDDRVPPRHRVHLRGADRCSRLGLRRAPRHRPGRLRVPSRRCSAPAV